jgi:hypothetical protein
MAVVFTTDAAESTDWSSFGIGLPIARAASTAACRRASSRLRSISGRSLSSVAVELAELAGFVDAVRSE